MGDTLFHRRDLIARLSVTGGDAAAFLQGQFSNDLRRTEACPATYGLWLNHKGRVLADSHVLQRGRKGFDVVSLWSPAAIIRERLETYIIADDVVLEDLTSGSAGVVIAGEETGDLLRAVGLAVPAPRCFAAVDDIVLVPARADRAVSWCAVGAVAAIDALISKLAGQGSREVDRAEFDRSRVAAGVPIVPDELGPDDLAMEGGLEHDAISFTKGCYLGQEVMARLHNLGQVRRRLFVVTFSASAGSPAKGASLFAGAQKVGEVRAAIGTVAPGEAIGLAMLQTHAVSPGAMLGLAVNGPACVRVERLAEGRVP